MTAPGIVLVHGYSGRVEALEPVRRLLGRQHGESAVRCVHLPGHTDGTVPAFDARLFGDCIDQAVRSFRKENRRIILLGHSTGGILALDHLQRTDTVPVLLILASTPAAVRGRDLPRWEQHRRNRCAISLLNVARMVSWINRISAIPLDKAFPVLVLQGAADPLVPPGHARAWHQDRFCGPLRSVVIPRAGHDLFDGPGRETALDCIGRAVGDAVAHDDPQLQAAAHDLQAMDENVAGFLAVKPHSARHVVCAPGGLRALNKPVRLNATAETDPIQLNIEITSRCNLACGHCARSVHKRPGKDMDRDVFEYLLGLMPNTLKVVLVGLGEPTLHPQLADFVALATQKGHRVSLVTNAMALDESLSRCLIAAGLCSLTFSLDSVDPDIASRVRTGSDINRILHNIRSFTALAGGKIPTAVFTAVSMHTVNGLSALAATVGSLGVRAWMLSDLNFQWNKSQTFWQNRSRENQAAVADALRVAFSRSLPVLSVRGLEELGLARRYGDYLMTAPAALQQRSVAHRWCLSPWQTLPLDVEGNATVCDCRPHAVLGNMLMEPFSNIWNGPDMQAYRRWMRSAHPPHDCLVCPRY